MINEKENICGICGSYNVHNKFDVGWDIDPSGEERQHITTCKDCKAYRFFADRIFYTDVPDVDLYKEMRIYGNWIKKGDK